MSLKVLSRRRPLNTMKSFCWSLLRLLLKSDAKATAAATVAASNTSRQLISKLRRLGLLCHLIAVDISLDWYFFKQSFF